ncbi:MAG TPA: hypothetical protein VF320_11400 [Acidimicrobiales bacterium]
MPMRENCRHYESREYDDGEVARFCVLGLAPEQPWRCPDNCPKFELSANDGSFETGSLEASPVEDEPNDPAEDVIDVLRDAEDIVNEAVPRVAAELDHTRPPRRGWKFWKKPPPDDGGFNLSQR